MFTEKKGYDAVLGCSRELLFFMCFSHHHPLSFISFSSRGTTGWFIVGVPRIPRKIRGGRRRAELARCWGLRVVAMASLKVIPLVGVRPGHAKRVVLAELSRGRKDRADRWHLSCAREEGGPMVPRQRDVLQ